QEVANWPRRSAHHGRGAGHPVNGGSAGRAFGAPRRFAGERRPQSRGLLPAWRTPIPPPPVSVAGWPLIGEPLAKAWTLASENLEEALRQASPLLKGFGRWLLSANPSGRFLEPSSQLSGNL